VPVPHTIQERGMSDQTGRADRAPIGTTGACGRSDRA
jgi:hypothetical protein